MQILQLNKYETDPYFLQIFQSGEPICEPEITPVLYHLENQSKTISRSVFSSQILQNAKMNIVVHWKF